MCHSVVKFEHIAIIKCCQIAAIARIYRFSNESVECMDVVDMMK